MAERSRPGTSPPPESAGPFASSWRRRHLTVDERVARGLAARQEAPRSSHGRWEPAPDRPDPVTQRELGEDVRDVGLDGGLSEDEPVGDLGVRQATAHQHEHLPLPLGQAREATYVVVVRSAMRKCRDDLCRHAR